MSEEKEQPSKLRLWTEGILMGLSALLLISFFGFISHSNKNPLEVNPSLDIVEEVVEQPPIPKIEEPIKKLEVIAEIEDVRDEIKHRMIDWMSIHAQWYIPRSELEVIYNEALKYPYPEMVLAIISVESNFNRYAMNKRTDCYGLMQVRWMIWKNEAKAVPEIGDHLKNVDELFDPERNVEFGNKILMSYKGEDDDWENALLRYSNGSSKYTAKVLTRYYELISVIGE